MTDWILGNPGNSVLEPQDYLFPVNIWSLTEDKDHILKNFMFIVYKPDSHPIQIYENFRKRCFWILLQISLWEFSQNYIGWESSLPRLYNIFCIKEWNILLNHFSSKELVFWKFLRGICCPFFNILSSTCKYTDC